MNILKIRKNIILSSVATILLSSSALAGDKRLNITYINHFHAEQKFGQSVHSFAQAAADDLNIDLTIPKIDQNKHKSLNRFEYIKFVEKNLNVTQKPDLMMAIFFEGTAQKVLELSKKYDVPVMIVNTGIPNSEKKVIGNPRENYKNFLGLVAADEKSAGNSVGKYLIDTIRKKQSNKKLIVVGLSGPRESPEATDRANGLKQAVSNDGNSVVKQIVHANWDIDIAYKQTKKLIKRYKNLDIVWCASDGMSLGARKAIVESGKKDTIVTGGIDWTKDGVDSVKNKEMSVTAGGHFMNGGFALVLLHDYYFGKDFKSELGTNVNINMALITTQNVDGYLKNFSSQDWDKIDFSKFSKVTNTKVKKYDFSLDNLIKNSDK